jgi:hypothetical protein
VPSSSSIIVKALTFLAIAYWPSLGVAKDTPKKTSLADAIYLIDMAAESVRHRHEVDPRRRIIDLETAASFVMLGVQDRMADSLDRLVDAMNSDRSTPESLRIRLWLEQAAGLAIAQGDAGRARHIVSRASLKWYNVVPAVEALGPWSERSALALVEAAGVADRRLRYVLCRDGQVSIVRRVLKPLGDGELVELNEIGDVSVVDAAIEQARAGRTIDIVSLIWLARRQAFRGRLTLARSLVAEASRDESRSVMTGAIIHWQYRGWEQRCPWRIPDVVSSKPGIGVVQAAWRPGQFDHDTDRNRPMVPLADLAAALAGGDDADGESRRLLDQLKALADHEAARGTADHRFRVTHYRRPNGASLAMWAANKQALADIQSRIELARFVVGSSVGSGRSLPGHVSDYVEHMVNFPNSRLAARILEGPAELKAAFPDEREYRQVAAFANLVFGRAVSLEPFPSDDQREWFEEQLNRAVESFVHVERTNDARKMVNAVRASIPGFRWNANTLLAAEMVDDAKKELRRRLAEGDQRFASAYAEERFAAALALSALGESLDLFELLSKPDAKHPELRDWIVALGITAYSSDPAQVDAVRRRPPATLQDADPDIAEATLLDAEGIFAISLARHGDLETALKLVASRNLRQRWLFQGPHWHVDGYDLSQVSVFDMPFLVQQWAARGHAVR